MLSLCVINRDNNGRYAYMHSTPSPDVFFNCMEILSDTQVLIGTTKGLMVWDQRNNDRWVKHGGVVVMLTVFLRSYYLSLALHDHEEVAAVAVNCNKRASAALAATRMIVHFDAQSKSSVSRHCAVSEGHNHSFLPRQTTIPSLRMDQDRIVVSESGRVNVISFLHDKYRNV